MVEESAATGQVRIPLTQRVGVGSKDAQLTERILPVVENIKRVGTKLQIEALRELIVLQDGHVPHVEIGRIERVASTVGEGADSRLNVPGIRIPCHIPNGILCRCGACPAGSGSGEDERRTSRRIAAHMAFV